MRLVHYPRVQNLETLAAAAMARAFSRRDPWDEFRLEASVLFMQLLKGAGGGDVVQATHPHLRGAFYVQELYMTRYRSIQPRFPAPACGGLVWRL